MAKCKALWFGNDSTGHPIEVALSVDNVYFFRTYKFNGYQKTWSKWLKLNDDEVKHPIYYINAYDNEHYYWNDDKTPNFNIIEWGFTNLRGGMIEDCRYRLPNL